MAGQLVLLRHGQSTWNLENLFTGWVDVDLTEQGRNEARAAGRLLKEQGFEFQLAFTSVLKRAIRTLWIALDEMDRRQPALRVSSDVLRAAYWKAAHDGLDGRAIDLAGGRRSAPTRQLLTDFVDRLESRPEGVRIEGWATAVHERADRVEVRLEDRVVATTRDFAPRPDVAAFVGAGTATGSTTAQYQLDLVKIHKGTTASAAKASASLKAGRKLLAERGRLPFRFDVDSGTLERRSGVVGDVARSTASIG